MIEVGIKGYAETVVDETNTAAALGSGLLPVYATPALVALAEEAAWKSVADALDEGQGTVGTKLDLSHIAATPVGVKVHCDAELVEIDRRRLVFSIQVFDEKEKIAEGTHERFIIDNDRFLTKANGKRES